MSRAAECKARPLGASRSPKAHASKRPVFPRRPAGETVDHGRQHAHRVSAGPVHADLARDRAAKNIAAADHQREFATQFLDFLDFLGECLDRIAVDTEIVDSGENLAGDFENNPFILRRTVIHGGFKARAYCFTAASPK